MHSFLERTQLEQAGRFSSHLILRNLQLLQPVLTFGLLVLARFGLCEASIAVLFMADIVTMLEDRSES